MASEPAKERVVLSMDVNPTHYNVEISTKIGGDFKFKGKVIIDVSVKKEGLTSITLHAKELELESASLASLTTTNFTYDEKDEMVTMTFTSPLPVGDQQLTITYKGLHNDKMAGFYRSGYTGSDGTKKTMLSTQFEPLAARQCLPCIDEPARKAEFTCGIFIDKGLTALSNMPVVSETEITAGEESGRVHVTFEKTPKMSTYLLAFCVGEFEYVETTTKNNVKLRVYTMPGHKSKGEFALDVGSKCLDLYDTMFGQPFPLIKMDMIAIPDFAMGAMENWGLITYREVDLLIDSVKASAQQKQRVATVVAHELAHQWFGNLVTMEWWDDLWLNEGFATWMQIYATDLIFPEWKLWEQFTIDQQAAALSLDSLASSHKIQVPIYRAQEVEQAFDIISYRKGASILKIVYTYLGHEHFFQGLKLYMERHKYGNTVTANLWQAWADASKKPVNEVMEKWTDQMGYPLVTITDYKATDGQVTLKLQQNWFLADGSAPAAAVDKKWKVPLFVSTPDGEIDLGIFEDKETEVTFKASAGWLKLNSGQNVLMRVKYSLELWEKLFEAVRKGELSPSDRTGLLLDALALVKAGNLDPAVLLQLLDCYKGELNYTVWVALGSALSSLHETLEGEVDLQHKFTNLSKNILLPAFEKVGWEGEAAVDGHLQKMLRALLIGHLVRFASDDQSILDQCRERFDTYVEDPSSEKASKALPSEYKTTVFRLVLKNSDSDIEYTQLMNTIEKLETTVEQKAVYLALGYIKSSELKLKTLDWTTSGVVKTQDFFYPMASVSFSGNVGLEITWKYLQENFQKFVDLLKGASASLMGTVIELSASGFTTMERADEIEAFFKDKDVNAEVKVKQVVEATRNRAKFKTLLIASTKFAESLNKY